MHLLGMICHLVGGEPGDTMIVSGDDTLWFLTPDKVPPAMVEEVAAIQATGKLEVLGLLMQGERDA